MQALQDQQKIETLMATKYTSCPHILANPEKFSENPRDGSQQKIHTERISNKHALMECHDCVKARIELEWSKTELGRKMIAHMRRVDLIRMEGGVCYAPEGLIVRVMHTWVNPRGETVTTPAWQINDNFPVPEWTPPEVVVEAVVEKAPEAPPPDAAELREFLEPIVAANEKFVGLWKQGKIGPLVGAAMRVAKGKYEGKYVEAMLKEIVGV